MTLLPTHVVNSSRAIDTFLAPYSLTMSRILSARSRAGKPIQPILRANSMYILSPFMRFQSGISLAIDLLLFKERVRTGENGARREREVQRDGRQKAPS